MAVSVRSQPEIDVLHTASTVVLAGLESRFGLILSNKGSNPIYVAFGVDATTAHLKIAAGATLQIVDPPSDAINAIADTGTTKLNAVQW